MMAVATHQTEILFQLNFVIIKILTGSMFISDQGMHNNSGHQSCLICAHILQHLLVPPVRCTHQSMPIIRTMSTELRGAMPTVLIIQVVSVIILGQKTTSTVMVHNLD